MKNIGYVGIDIQFVRLTQKDLDTGLVHMDMYDLPTTDLSQFAGLMITNFVDESFMLTHKEILEQYLDTGGVIFSFAEMSESYLPNAPIWHRSPTPIREREIIVVEPINPIFEGIDPYDLNVRQGVKGFFTRGYFEEIPAGAEVIVQDELGKPVIYIDRKSTNGVLIVGSGTDLYQVYRSEQSSANRLTTQIPNYIRTLHQELKEQRS